MNRTNFVLTGGWPLNAERLEELETAYSIFNALGALAGDLTIISGCTTVGSTVTDGFVYISGELLTFKTGAVTPTSTVIIIEEKVNRAFESTEIKAVHTIRYATFGTAETSWLWTDFKAVDPMVVMMAKIKELEKKTAIFQRGGVVFPWFKPVNEIPSGFQEAVDIRGRTIIGYDPDQVEFNQIGKKDGAKEKIFTPANLPEHDHFQFANESVDAGLTLSSTNTPVKEGYNSGGDGNQNYRIRGTNNPATVGKTSKTGTAAPFSILNPYAIAAYIEYIG
jgi:hypothetical protein